MLLSNLFLQFMCCWLFLYCLYLIGLTRNIYTIIFLIWCICVLGCVWLNTYLNIEILTIIFLFIQTGVLMIFLIFNFIIGWRSFTIFFTESAIFFFTFCYFSACWCIQYFHCTDTINFFTTTYLDTISMHFGDLFFNFCVIEWCLINCYLCCAIFCCNLIYYVSKQQRAYHFLCIRKFANFFFLK